MRRSLLRESIVSGDCREGDVLGEESWLMATNGKIDVCYNVQTAVDAKHKLIAEFEVTSEGTDHNQLTPVIERTKTVLGTETLTVVADDTIFGNNPDPSTTCGAKFRHGLPPCSLSLTSSCPP
jgi:hypothetical protein